MFTSTCFLMLNNGMPPRVAAVTDCLVYASCYTTISLRSKPQPYSIQTATLSTQP